MKIKLRSYSREKESQVTLWSFVLKIYNKKRAAKLFFCGIKNTNAYNRVGVESDINHYTNDIIRMNCVQYVFKVWKKCENQEILDLISD